MEANNQYLLKMREQSKTAKKILATVFEAINEQYQNQGINKLFKYEFNTTVENEGEENEFKGKSLSIIVKELGHKDRVIQQFNYIQPKELDKFTMEYNVVLDVLKHITETSLLTWVRLGELLNSEEDFQKNAITAIQHGEEDNTNTDKQS